MCWPELILVCLFCTELMALICNVNGLNDEIEEKQHRLSSQERRLCTYENKMASHKNILMDIQINLPTGCTLQEQRDRVDCLISQSEFMIT